MVAVEAGAAWRASNTLCGLFMLFLRIDTTTWPSALALTCMQALRGLVQCGRGLLIMRGERLHSCTLTPPSFFTAGSAFTCFDVGSSSEYTRSISAE